MIAVLFLLLAVPFVFLLAKAFSSGEVLARGWGFTTRTYDRDSQPLLYWVTVVSYLVIVVWATVFAALAGLGRLF